GGYLLVAFFIGLDFQILLSGVFKRGFFLGVLRLGGFSLLLVIAQRGLFPRQCCLGLMQLLFIVGIFYVEVHLAPMEIRFMFVVEVGVLGV
ncbi:hypothetical protein, partial [Klebsiella pneumoniae]|uniref:hypothetical protein n=1 Tax=Klebsiella pneumoniae TaxID=573 RepID=UPI003C6D0263